MASALMPAVVFVGVLGVGSYPFLMLVDLLLATHLEKKYLFYPMLEFKCFCGLTVKLLTSRFTPTATRDFLRVRNHTKSCLVWLFNAEFNGLTPYFACSYRKDIQEKDATARLMGDTWALNWAKKRSKRVKEGKDPWKEDESNA